MQSNVDITAFINSLERDYQPIAHAACRQALILFANNILSIAQERAPRSPLNKFMPGKGPPRGKATIKNPGFTGHSGFLSNSGYAMEPVGEGENTTIVIGFNTEYAAAVHEILTAHHTTGRSKYLESAMQDEAPRLRDFVVTQMHEALDNRGSAGGST